jgi:hypothetical protein
MILEKWAQSPPPSLHHVVPLGPLAKERSSVIFSEEYKSQGRDKTWALGTLEKRTESLNENLTLDEALLASSPRKRR